jgi:hypothetical protein
VNITLKSVKITRLNVKITRNSVKITCKSVEITRMRPKSHAFCENHTFAYDVAASQNPIRIFFGNIMVRFKVTRIVLKFNSCVYKSHSYVSKSHSACSNRTRLCHNHTQTCQNYTLMCVNHILRIKSHSACILNFYQFKIFIRLKFLSTNIRACQNHTACRNRTLRV